MENVSPSGVSQTFLFQIHVENLVGIALDLLQKLWQAVKLQKPIC
jgi:hypothetical protein